MFGTVHDLGELPGIAELAASVGAQEPTEEAAIELSNAIDASDLPLQGVLGVRDSIRSTIAWLSGRRLVRTLPPVMVPLPWFECHVPHNGAVRMTIEQSRQKEYAVDIKVFGSGYGRGRRFGVTVTQETGRRTTCTDYIVVARATPVVYADNGIESVVLNIVDAAGLRVVANAACDRCSIEPEQLDPIDYSLGEYIDLRSDDNDTRWRIAVSWRRARNLAVKVSIPHVNTEVNVEGTATSELVWKLSYTLRAGGLYLPYHRSSEIDLLPPMWAFAP